MNESGMTDAGLDQQRRAAREALAHDVDLLVEKVSPSAVMDRRMNRVRHWFVRNKTRASVQIDETMEDIGGSMQGAMQGVGETVQGFGRSTASMARTRARQTPLAAGALFFALGWALSRVIPMSRSEEEVLGQVSETVSQKAGPIVDEAKTAVTESAKEAIAHR